jgi:hypothetical protein
MKKAVNFKQHVLFCVVFLYLFSFSFKVIASEKPLIFPIPQEMQVLKDVFILDEKVSIIVPENASENDLSLAHMLVGELSAKYSLALKIETLSKIPKDRNVIVMGTIANPLIKNYCAENNLSINQKSPGTEGYILQVNDKAVVIGGWDDPGAFYGMQSFRQLLMNGNGKTVQGVRVRDWPNLPFRGIRLFVPGPENLAFFSRFIKDFMALYKYNKLIMEVNCMRLDKHPEVNAGWIEFSKYMQYTRTNSTEGLYGENKNSTHHDAGDGYILEKDEIRGIVKNANSNFIEVIPEIPSLTHAYYLLTRHHELAEYQGDIWPDTYCPSNPDSYKLMFDVYDEYVDVIHPKMVHIGHDEWWGAPVGSCPLCKGKDYSMLFAGDVIRIHNYFAKKGIKVAMWGDYLLESLRDTLYQDHVSSTGVKYQTPGGVRPEVVRDSIPKDILIFNWFWQDPKRDMEIQKFGFKQIYGNMKSISYRPIPDWDTRRKGLDVIGGAPSSWAATNEYNFGKDFCVSFLACANLLWSKHILSDTDAAETVRSLIPSVFTDFRGLRIPSQDGDPIVQIDISQAYNFARDTKLLAKDLSNLISGEVKSKSVVFNLPVPSNISDKCLIAVGTQGVGENTLPTKSNSIPINDDVSSLIFLHASARPAENKYADYNIPDYFDSADLLGWYEVVYEDGYKEIIPVQYAVNILCWRFDPPRKTGRGDPEFCYAATPVNCSVDMKNNPVTFYSYEWVNKRYGKVIKEVNLYGTTNYQANRYEFGMNVPFAPLPTNAIILAGISKVLKRKPFVPKSNLN